LGAGTIVTNSDQFIVASNINSFIIPGLTQLTGSGEGIILEYNSSGNIIPSAGTYNIVSKIDTELSSLHSSLNTNTSDISTGIDGGGLASLASGILCGGSGGIGLVNTGTYGTGGMGTILGSSSTVYETSGTNEQSGNRGLNTSRPKLCLWNGRSWWRTKWRI